jgi:hypothetical protein
MAHSGESIWRDGIAFEELGRIYLETVTSKVVGKELDDLLMGLGWEEAVGQRTRLFGNSGDSMPKTSVK